MSSDSDKVFAASTPGYCERHLVPLTSSPAQPISRDG